MKKLFLIVLLTVVSSMALSSCTEENVQPTEENPGQGNGGGNGSTGPY